MEAKRYETKVVCGSSLLCCLCAHKTRKFVPQCWLVILRKTKDNSDCTAASEACPLVRTECGDCGARNVPKYDSALKC
jgi:hypothetical protein